LQLRGFASNEVNYGIRIELLPCDFGAAKTLIQEPAGVPEVVAASSWRTA
jgi:hypothetical protein